MLANDVLAAQLRNLIAGVTGLGKYLVGVLAETRRLARGPRARLRQRERRADAAIAAVLDDHAAMRGMRLRQRLGYGMHGSRGNARA